MPQRKSVFLNCDPTIGSSFNNENSNAMVVREWNLNVSSHVNEPDYWNLNNEPTSDTDLRKAPPMVWERGKNDNAIRAL